MKKLSAILSLLMIFCLCFSMTAYAGDTDVQMPTIAQPHTHHQAKAVEENRVEATCTTDGSYDRVIYCSFCGIQLIRTRVPIRATGHTEAQPVRENYVAPTADSEGSCNMVTYCAVCGIRLSEEYKVFAAGSLPEESADFEGPGIKPDLDGKTPAAPENPTSAEPAAPQEKVPTLPKPKLKKVKAAKKSATVSWKKLTKKQRRKIKKIQIQYSTNKTFKGAKTKTVKATKTSYIIKGLKSKKKYYIRIRAVKGSEISAWSKTKAVKVK